MERHEALIPETEVRGLLRDVFRILFQHFQHEEKMSVGGQTAGPASAIRTWNTADAMGGRG